MLALSYDTIEVPRAHDGDSIFTPPEAEYRLFLDGAIEQRAAELGIPSEVTGPTYAIIGLLDRVDAEHKLEWGIEAREVLLLSLDIGQDADRSMGVRTNPAAVFAAGGTHDGGKAVIAEDNPGILIRSHYGGFTPEDFEANKKHVLYSADLVRKYGMPLIAVELFPGGPVELADIAKVDQASHDKQTKGNYELGPKLEWGERRVRDYATLADQILAMLLRDNGYNKHRSLAERWAWIEGTPEEVGAIAYVLDDYWYPPEVIAAVIGAIKRSELVRARLAKKFGAAADSAGHLVLAAAY